LRLDVELIGIIEDFDVIFTGFIVTFDEISSFVVNAKGVNEFTAGGEEPVVIMFVDNVGV
jgi:hypothetical protein